MIRSECDIRYLQLSKPSHVTTSQLIYVERKLERVTALIEAEILIETLILLISAANPRAKARRPKKPTVRQTTKALLIFMA